MFNHNSPIWNILFLVIGSLLTYGLAIRQKQKDTVTEARKSFLEKRIETHMKLLEIIASARITIGPSSHVDVNFYVIFKDISTMNIWFDNLLHFILYNKPLLSKEIIKQSVILNNIRKIIELIRVKKSMNTDAALMNFGTKYFKDFFELFNSLEKSIQSFFETEINLKYAYPILSENDYKEAEEFIKSFAFVTDNINNEEYFSKF